MHFNPSAPYSTPATTYRHYGRGGRAWTGGSGAAGGPGASGGSRLAPGGSGARGGPGAGAGYSPGTGAGYSPSTSGAPSPPSRTTPPRPLEAKLAALQVRACVLVRSRMGNPAWAPVRAIGCYSRAACTNEGKHKGRTRVLCAHHNPSVSLAVFVHLQAQLNKAGELGRMWDERLDAAAGRPEASIMETVAARMQAQAEVGGRRSGSDGAEWAACLFATLQLQDMEAGDGIGSHLYVGDAW